MFDKQLEKWGVEFFEKSDILTRYLISYIKDGGKLNTRVEYKIDITIFLYIYIGIAIYD